MSASVKLEARVDPQFKQEITLAARLENRSLTDYILAHLRPSVQKTLQREQILELNAQDSLRLAQALFEEEPRDLPYLRGALKEHQKRGF